jgi:maltose alpha-D-glucosyltransferase/alpha-amylase
MQTRHRPDDSQWAMFLRNHDELDLGRLSPAQREIVFEEMGSEPNMQLYDRGIRRRLAPMLDGDRRRLELAYSLLFSLPGTPVMRYGDEIGMGENLKLRERNAVRTPMQWSKEEHAGFTRAEKPFLPVIQHGPYGYKVVNAAVQKTDPSSLLNWTERIIRARKEAPELGWGEFELLQTGHHSVLAIRCNWRNNSLVTIHNFADEAIEIELHLGDAAGRKLRSVFKADDSEADRHGRHHIIMEAYGYQWYRVGGLGYLLDRADY